MFTAKFKKTDDTAQGTRFYVDFTDGTTVFTEYCIPQDEVGFNHWVKSRLSALNTAEKLKTTLTKDAEIVVPEPEEVVVELTDEEKARNAWLEQWSVYSKANRAMKELADAGIEPTPEELTRFNALKTWVADNRKPEYSQFM